jgi:hypothetical protein
MTMKLTHTQRTRFGRDRDRRIGRITEVAPATSVVRPPVAISPADPLGTAREARLHAERQLRRSELERDQTARALELNLSPMALDEAGRERLRAAYAEVAARVEINRGALDRARAVEEAAVVISQTIDDEDGAGRAIVEGLAQLLVSRNG